jgi:hypothetical protein
MGKLKKRLSVMDGSTRISRLPVAPSYEQDFYGHSSYRYGRTAVAFDLGISFILQNQIYDYTDQKIAPFMIRRGPMGAQHHLPTL